MASFLWRRLLTAGPVVLGVATLVFALLHATPGDPVDAMLGETAVPAQREELRRALGLDAPIATQYARFLTGLARGDLGTSFRRGRPVAGLVAERYPATLELAAAALVVALAIGVPAGIAAAVRRGSWIDHVASTAALAGVSLPSFWLGPMLVAGFAIRLDWLPVSGRDGAAAVLLPAITLGSGMAGILARMTRASLLETLDADHVRTARAKGAPEWVVVLRHALRPALVPLVTLVGMQFGALLAGSVITETVFAWPGIGKLFMDAVQSRDYPVVQGVVLAIALSYVLVNLATDLLYAWADPTIRVGEGRAAA